MLSKEKNELLTRVGPGTPMNALFRRYWIPALLSSDLESDGDPKRVRLLGEEYVAFRDSAGNVGVLDNTCCHRGTALTLGRNENGGLRCLFHGWKYAVDGTVLETPNVPDPAYKTRVKQPAYPVREAGDLVWVYLGDPAQQPSFREYEYMRLPSSHRAVMRLDMDCNFLQVLEGGLDSSHVGILHHDLVFANDLSVFPTQIQRRQKVSSDSAPRIEVRDTEFGFHYAAIRVSNDGSKNNHVRVTAYVAPATVMIPPNMYIVHYIPYDDTHTGWILTHWNPDEPIEWERVMRATGLDAPGVWVDGKVMQNADNGYLQDRKAMRNGSWSGLYGVACEDAAVNLAQGPVLDRTKEHLVQADAACTHVRRHFLLALDAMQRGEEPPGIAPSSAGTIQALDFLLPAGEPWMSGVPGNVGIGRGSAGVMPVRVARAALAVLLALFALGGPMAGANSATLAVLNIATVGNENDALAFYARDAGFFQKNGIDAHIEILRAASGAGIAAAVVGGAADIGESDIVSLAAAHEHGVPLVALAPSFKVRNTDLTTVLVVAKDSPIKSARDLAEKVVAVPSLTGPLKLATVAWLQKEGVDTAALRFVEMPQINMGPALVRGTIVAAVTTEPNYTAFINDVTVIAPVYEVFGKAVQVSAWNATETWVKNNPDLARRFIVAMHDAAAWANNTNNHPASLAIFEKYVPIEPALLAKMHRAFFGTEFVLAEMQPLLDAAVAQKSLTARVPAKELLSPLARSR